MTELRFSGHEYNVLWRRLGYGEKHLMLDIPDHGGTLTERHAIDERSWEELRRRGIVTGRRVDPDVADVLGAVACPLVEAELRSRTGPDAELRVLAVRAGIVGAVAAIEDGGLTVRQVRSGQVAAALLDSLPDHPSAPGDAISFPRSALDAGLRPDGPLDRLEHAGLSARDARQFGKLLSGRMLRQTKLGAAGRDRLGRRRRHPEVLTVLDTEAGRCIVHCAGPDRVLLAPASRRRLVGELDALVRTAQAAATRR